MANTGPFSARFFLLLISFIHLGIYFFKESLEMNQQKKPLPEPVADIYNRDRYSKFISREGEIRKLYFIYYIVNFIIDNCILFSPIFAAIERVTGGNVYFTVLITYFTYWLASEITELPYDYYFTFIIDEKYNLNRMTRKEFLKDELLSVVEDIVSSLGLAFLIAFCGEHMSRWTNGFTVGWRKTVLIGLGVYGALVVTVVIITLVQFFLWKKKYSFTPLPEGNLRDKIKALMVECKKKVSEIYVYDESKKSTEKNAFLLKLFWHREFGIADNFVNENDERELLAVLSHEIGHLKHKKDILDFIDWAISIAVSVFLLSLLCNPSPALGINHWVRDSFQITQNNYYVLLSVYAGFMMPITFVTKRFSNYKSRRNEYEADMEAVKNGLGEELISTFSKMTSDELIDLNPHPLLEWLDYDHPGMYTRISYIREATARSKHMKPHEKNFQESIKEGVECDETCSLDSEDASLPSG